MGMKSIDLPMEVQQAIESATPGWQWTSGYRALKAITWNRKKEQVVWEVFRYDRSDAIRIIVGRMSGRYNGMTDAKEYTMGPSEVAIVATWLFNGANGDCPVPLTQDQGNYKLSENGLLTWEKTKR